MQRQCKYCLQDRDNQLFATDRSTQCIICKREYRKNYARLPENRIRRRTIILKHKYGITEEEFNSKLQSQDNKCEICGESGKFHLDHSHETGVIRGILCNHCNRGLGGFKDNPIVLNKAIEYLKKYT